MMDFNAEKMYHIGLTPEQGARYALLTGDPGRVESMARRLEQPTFLASNREYCSFSGVLEGERVLVISHGIGGPSTAICAEELYRCGVRTMIRVGTCGGMAMDVIGGDVVVATAAIRAEGTALAYLPVEFPAVSDMAVASALTSAARAAGRRVHAGVVHCKDSFYAQHSPETSPVAQQLLERWQCWLKGGCLASEMESATLYIVAASLGFRAGCVLEAVWNQEREKAGLPNPRAAEGAVGAIDTAVEGLRLLIREDRGCALSLE